jgi:hypothetical protein
MKVGDAIHPTHVNDVYYSVCGYARKEKPKYLRHMFAFEAKHLKNGQEVFIIGNDNHWRRARVTGQVKTWKTRPHHVKVPMRYGMYESFYIEYYGDWKYGTVTHAFIEVEVNDV